MSNDAVSQALEEVTRGFEEWVDTTLSNLNEEGIAQAIESMGKAFAELADSSYSGSAIKFCQPLSISLQKMTGLLLKFKDRQFCGWLFKVKMENGLATPKLELNKHNLSFTRFARLAYQNLSV
jgi:hypothetical protein